MPPSSLSPAHHVLEKAFPIVTSQKTSSSSLSLCLSGASGLSESTCVWLWLPLSSYICTPLPARLGVQPPPRLSEANAAPLSSTEGDFGGRQSVVVCHQVLQLMLLG